jgi:hypothetical protein
LDLRDDGDMGKSENVYRSRKKMLVDNFMGGIMWSLGVWIGTTVIIALLAFILSKINLIPIVGSFVAAIAKYVAVVNSPLHL